MELIRVLTREERLKYTDKTNDRWALFICGECKQTLARPKSNGIKQKRCGECRKIHGNFGIKHAKCGTALYTAWKNMKQRCKGNNTKSKTYVEKGITYDPKWETFDGFHSDMGKTYIKGLTIDRIDNSKGYYKRNCQWITMNENRVKDRIKTIRQTTIDGIVIREYPSSHEAARLLYPNLEIKTQRAKANSIARVARGERKSFNSYIWEYV